MYLHRINQNLIEMTAKQYENLPQQVKIILDSFDENKESYSECKRIEKELLKIGCTCDYYLDGVLFDVMPKNINLKNS
jgi:vancomycin permeability regulator SanA